jgi:RimJ/RimL family protein N-acetyltransferase
VNIPTITTRRLTLRPFREQDAVALHRIFAEDGILRYFPNPYPPSLERVQNLIAFQLQHWKEHGFGWWAVEPRDNQALIGWNGLQYLPDTQEIEIGYLLSRAFWGKGLATEGAMAGLRFGFQDLKLERIVGITHPENIASQRVLQKIGMSFTSEAEYFGMKVHRYLADASSFRKLGAYAPPRRAAADREGSTP